jgi:hypothetical protein
MDDMAEFLILIYGDEQQWDAETEEQQQFKDEAHRAFAAAVGRGLREGKELAASSSAVTLRGRGGRPLATDGPYAESKEVVGGYYLIDVVDLDEAVRLAGLLPELAMPYCSVEVRPVVAHEAE